MIADGKWRFAKSGHQTVVGITPANEEAFKKNKFKSFAREIIQNSIDASLNNGEPVIAEFKSFKKKTRDIPGVDSLIYQLECCKELWNYKQDYIDDFNEKIDVLNKEEITCLKISDFNTTGLIGVESSNQVNNKFKALVFGSGVSEKSGTTTGGSKGVGKNAAFLLSNVRTIFYSTVTNEDLSGNKDNKCQGFIGTANFASGIYKDSEHPEDNDHTQGDGYFGIDNMNCPLNKAYQLDNAVRDIDNPGTDIFIIGFEEENKWEDEVAYSILESFMVSVYKNNLIVKINDNVISKETLFDSINKLEIKPKEKNYLLSMHKILIGDGVTPFDIDTDYGTCFAYILRLKKEEADLATHTCAMIRYPYMKIKDISIGGDSLLVSALCIIEDGKLGKKLLSIENPQHLDWETKRISNPHEKKEMDRVIANIKKQISDCVQEVFKDGGEDSVDPFGAGDFLPDSDVNGENNDQEENANDGDDESTFTRNKPKEITTSNENEDGKEDNEIIPDIGSTDGDEGEGRHPDGKNDHSGNSSHAGDEKGKILDGDDEVFKIINIKSIKSHVFCLNPETGKWRIIFVPNENVNDCYLSIYKLDDGKGKEKVSVNEIYINGVFINKIDDKFDGFKLIKNQKMIADIVVNEKGKFLTEVKLKCK